MGKERARIAQSVVLAGLLLLSACQSAHSSVFSDECGPPCWRGIRPGSTHMQEALDVAGRFPDLGESGIETTRGSWYIFSRYMEFKLRSGETVDIYMIDDVVALIIFFKPKGIATLGSCAAAFGSPDYAAESTVLGPGLPFLPASDRYHTWFYGIYPSRGIVFGYDSSSAWFGEDLSLHSNTIISDIRFFDVKEYNELLRGGFLIYAEHGFSQDKLHPWKGYGDIHKLYP